MIREIKRLKKLGFCGEIFQIQEEKLPVQFKNGRLYSIEEHNTTGYGVRLIKDGKVGFSSVNRKENLETAIEAAKESAGLGVPAKFEFPSPAKVKENMKLFDKETAELKVDAMVNLGKEILDSLERIGKGMNIDVELERFVRRIRILNTEGLDYQYEKTGWKLFIVLFGVIENSFTWIYDIHLSAKFQKNIRKHICYIKDLYKKANKIAPPVKGKKDVIFMPSCMTTLIGPIAAGVNGENIRKGTSPLIGKLGKKLFNEDISIIDNPFRAWAYGSMPIDDEGVPAKKKFIINKGVLENYILDLRSASALGMKPTGNGLRRGPSLPSPEFTNIELLPGEIPLKEMIQEMKDGLIVYTTLGAGQSNILAGDFSVNASLAFRVRNGEVIGRVKDTMIAGNVYNLLKRIKAVSKERTSYMGMLLPAVKIEKVDISSK